MESFAYVDFKHNLKRLHCETQIKDIIVSKIREMPNLMLSSLYSCVILSKMLLKTEKLQSLIRRIL